MEHERIGETIIESFQLGILLLDLPGGTPGAVRSKRGGGVFGGRAGFRLRWRWRRWW